MRGPQVHDGHGRCFMGKAPEFFFYSHSHTKLASLVCAIASAAVHGTDPLQRR